MSEYNYDVVVLGAGPGGYEAAIRCAQYGKNTALVEARDLGGTCLNRGCIPTKALLHGAEVYQSALNAASCGVTTGEVGFDFAKLAEYKDSVVAGLRKGIAGLEKAHGVKVINGFGKLVDEHTLDVDGEKVTFDKLILATGSAPARPPIPGIDGENVVTSDEVLSMTELPDSFVIIGGGVIGIEFVKMLSTRVLKRKKVTVINNAKVTGINGGEKVTVTYELNGAEKTAEGGCCVVAVGRRAMTANIGLENVGIEMNRAFVNIDDYCRTNIENIYAIGDITGKIQLAHVASAQGLAAAANACGQKSVKMDYSVVPSCIYTAPEIAFVGIGEEKAKQQGIEYKIGSFNVAGNGRAMIMGEALGIAKLISDADGNLIGAQLMGPRATDMIAELALALKVGASVETIAETIHPHPTVSEVIAEAAHDWEGLCCHSLPKKK